MATKTEYHEAGVYMVANKKSGANYIGSSIDLTTRLKFHLAATKHEPRYATQAYLDAFHGADPDDIEFRIIEFVRVPTTEHSNPRFGKNGKGLAKLREREAYWIHKLQPSVNHRGKRHRAVDVASLPVGPPMHIAQDERATA